MAEINPFIAGKKLDVLARKKQINFKIEVEDEKATSNVIGGKYQFDPEDKASMFKSPEFENLVFSDDKLATIGRKLLFYIMYKLHKNSDSIELARNVVCKDLGISQKTYHNGILFLSKGSFIKKKSGRSDHLYWVNPFLLFKGDRVKYFQEKDKGGEFINVKAIV